MKPDTSILPVSVSSGGGNTEGVRGLFHRQTREIAQLDEPCRRRVLESQPGQGIVDRQELIRGSLNTVVPVQTLFAIPALCLYFWFRHRYGPERTMVQFRAAVAAEKARIPAGPAPDRPTAVPQVQVGQPST